MSAAQSRRAARGDLASILFRSDLERYPQLSGAARRDWLAGRIALRAAAARFAPGAAVAGASVAYRDGGQPFLVGLGSTFCSIGHSAGWGVAGVSSRPIGVDIERIGPRPPSLLRWLIDDDEHEVMASTEPGVRVTVAWTVKEAALKLLGVGLAVHPRGLHLERATASGFEVRGPAAPLPPAKLFVRSLLVGDFAIAIAGDVPPPPGMFIGWYREPRV